MPFFVKAYIDDHTVTADADTAREAFAKAVDWHVAERLTDISISDGIKNYSIAEFSLMLAERPSLSPTQIMVFEVCLTATSGKWEWQVCCKETTLLRGSEATRELARRRGYDGMFCLLSLCAVS